MEKSNGNIMKRITKLREELKKKDFDAALISKDENCTYMSGFNGGESFLVITQDEALLITDFRYTEQATAQAPLYKVMQYNGNFAVFLNEVLKARGVSRLGFEDAHITFADYSVYKSKLDVDELLPLDGVVEVLRIIKDEEEIDVIRKAVEIADNAFDHILKFIKPGVAEVELAAELEYNMKKQGAKGQSFDMIVASGYRSSLPHGAASEKKLQPGEAITFDFGALYKDYCSDMTRTVFLGQPDEELKKIYNIVLEAQLESTKGAKAGTLGKDVDAIARDIIQNAGYGKYFGHGLGHGVGLEIHEEARFSPQGGKKMENGMVMTVEPGIYIPGLGGVRIEDMIIINNEKPMVLTRSKKEMIIL